MSPERRPRVGLLTREFPPEIYGGAGVHVENLARELHRLVDLEVHCFGKPRGVPGVSAHQPWDLIVTDGPEGAALATMSVDLLMAAALGEADLVHSHTWYANLAGHLAKLLYDVPHVMTTHSLEPLRPWKAEQLGGGYALSRFCEATAIGSADAVIAVSGAMRDDILAVYGDIHPDRVVVIHNGIDPEEWFPDAGTDALVRAGVDPDRPSVAFVGRVTRQKGVDHALATAALVDPEAQFVFCAGAPDTPEIGDEMRALARDLAERRGNVVWLEGMLDRADIVQLVSHATVLLSPSVYEPFGLTNLEAMACETAVVASAVGGITEVVVDGETGCLVGFEAVADELGSPADPDRFEHDLAARVSELLADPDKARRFGEAGRRRAIEHFGWPVIAGRTAALYRLLLDA